MSRICKGRRAGYILALLVECCLGGLQNAAYQATAAVGGAAVKPHRVPLERVKLVILQVSVAHCRFVVEIREETRNL